MRDSNRPRQNWPSALGTSPSSLRLVRPFSTPWYPIHRTARREAFPAVLSRVSMSHAHSGRGILGDNGTQTAEDQHRGDVLD
jgi:hypothetical protein